MGHVKLPEAKSKFKVPIFVCPNLCWCIIYKYHEIQSFFPISIFEMPSKSQKKEIYLDGSHIKSHIDGSHIP